MHRDSTSNLRRPYRAGASIDTDLWRWDAGTLAHVLTVLRETVGSQDAEGYARNCEALAESRSARLELITCPVLIVNGDEDPVTPLQGARHLSERLPNARLETLSRCGHWPMLERPAECQRALRDFLQSVR